MPDMVNTQMVGATPAADVPDAPVVTVDTASIATTLALTTLDASGSSDPAGGSLSFAWTMDTKPTGSAAALSGSATATETFTPDKSGTYSGSATATSSETGKSAATRWVRRVRGALSAAFGSDSYQQADTTAITGLATQLGGLTVSGGVTPYTYSWTINGAATGLSDAAAADPNVTVTALDGGTLVNARHAVECTVTDAAGNTATAAGWVEIGDASLGSGGPTATVGGSTALWAALTAQDGVTALSLSAASVTAGATLQWTVYGPTGSDETAQLITAGDTTATPTWAAFSSASGRIAGNWSIRLDVTASGLTTTYTRTVAVGAGGGVATRYDLSALGASDYTAGGATRDIGGVTADLYNQGAAVWGSDGTDGIDVSPDASVAFVGGGVRSGPCMTVDLADLFSGYDAVEDDVAIAVRLSYSTAPSTGTAGFRVGVVDGAPTTTSTELLSLISLPGAVQKGCLYGTSGSSDSATGSVPALGIMFRMRGTSLLLYSRATDFSGLTGDDAPGGANWTPATGATSGRHDMQCDQQLDANDVSSWTDAAARLFIGAQGGSGAQDWAGTVRDIFTWRVQ